MMSTYILFQGGFVPAINVEVYTAGYHKLADTALFKDIPAAHYLKRRPVPDAWTTVFRERGIPCLRIFDATEFVDPGADSYHLGPRCCARTYVRLHGGFVPTHNTRA